MKWSIQQLHKLAFEGLDFNGEYDFSDYIIDFDDIADIEITKVTGTAYYLYDDRFEIELNIKTELTVLDARTLEPLKYKVDLNVVEIFDSVVEEDEDIVLIEKNTIDLKDTVWENIILRKPIRIVKEELNQ